MCLGNTFKNCILWHYSELSLPGINLPGIKNQNNLSVFSFARKTQKEEHGAQAGPASAPAQAQGSPFRSINVPESGHPSEDFTNILPSQTYEKGTAHKPWGISHLSFFLILRNRALRLH